MWEAFQHAGWEGLDNLTAIIDVNRLGQTRETMLGWDLDGYVAPRRGLRLERDRDRRPRRRRDRGRLRRGRARPPAGRRRSSPGPRRARASRRSRTSPASTASRSTTPRRRSRSSAASATCASTSPSRPATATPHALRDPRRRAAVAGSSATRSRPARPTASRSPRSADMRGDVVALDGEVSNSTHSEDFREAHPDRYFEMFIAEQQLVAAAVGMQARGWMPFASTFAAFLVARLRLRPHGRDLARRTSCCRLARRRLDRRGRPVADGARGHRLAARDPRLDRPAPERRQPDGASSWPRWPTATGISFMRTLRGKTPVRTAPGRGRARSAAAAWSPTTATTSPIVACGITRRRGGQGRRAARRATASTRACSTPTRSSRSTPRRVRAAAAQTAARSSPSRTTARGRPRRRGARGAGRRATSAPPSSSSRCARCPAPARPRSCCTARGSTPTAIAEAVRSLNSGSR